MKHDGRGTEEIESRVRCDTAVVASFKTLDHGTRNG